MKIQYDPKVDAAYVRFLEGDFECTTLQLTETVAINIAPGGKVVGIEVLDASENLELVPTEPKVALENLIAV